MSVLDLKARALLGSMPVCTGARELALRADDAFLYVACFNDDRLDVIRTSTNSLERSIQFDPLTRPLFVTSAPLGSHAYVIGESAALAVVDSTSFQVVDTIEVNNSPRAVAITPDGALAYVLQSKSITVFDAVTGDFRDHLPLSDDFEAGSPRAVDIVITPDGRKAYASQFRSAPARGRVFVIDTAAGGLVKTLEFSQRASRLALTPDGGRLYVTSNTTGAVQVISTATDTVVDEIDLSSTGGIAIAPVP